eukprot:jgi/Ulvmu1/3947/UM018_0170.1
MNALKHTAENIMAPQAIAFVCKLTAVCAIACFATIGFSTGFMLNAYVYASRTWVPSRSHYERPLFFEYNATAAVAQVTFLDWHQTPEGYHVAPQRVEFLRSKDKVNMYVDLTLPESQENKGLFQLRSALKSDAGVILHSTTRPLAIPHRSPLVSALRDLALFPCYLAGLVSESVTLRNTVTQNFVETPAAPLAAVEVVVTGARPMHVPPLIHSGAITVDVHLSWTQRVLSVARFSPLLHMCIALVATALMFLSSAAALCSCVLCFQTVATFWAETGGARGQPGGDGGPLRRATAAAVPTADVLREAKREIAAALRDNPAALLRDAAPAESGAGGAAESGTLTGAHDEHNGAGGHSSQHRASLCDSPTFKSQVKAAVEEGSAKFHASHLPGTTSAGQHAQHAQHSHRRSVSLSGAATVSNQTGLSGNGVSGVGGGKEDEHGSNGAGGGGGAETAEGLRRRRPPAASQQPGDAAGGPEGASQGVRSGSEIQPA